MGQQLFKPDFEYSKQSNEISISFDDKISSIFPWKIHQILQNSNEKDFLDLQSNLIKQIRNEIFQLTNSNHSNQLETFINEISSSLQNSHQNSLTKMKEIWEKQKQLRINFHNEDQQNQSSNEDPSNKLIFIAIQSLTSILLILIKSVEKTDETILHQILSLTIQLIEQIPIKSFSIYSKRFYQSINPIYHFIEDLSYSQDLFLSNRSIEILFHFAFIKSSFKDLLSLIHRFLFDTNHNYNFKNLFIKLNQNLSQDHQDNRIDLYCKEYLQLNGISEELSEKEWNGQMICSIFFAFIQLDQSFSFQFHLDVFKQLFEIIHKLFQDENHNSTMDFLLTISLHLLRKHFEYYFHLNNQFYDKIFSNEEHQSNQFISNEQFNQWFPLFYQISTSNSNEFIREESSNILMLILHFKSSSFEEKLLFINQILSENPSEMLTKTLFNQMNDEIQLIHLIEILFKGNSNELLNPLIDKYLNENNQMIEQILLSLQNLMLYQLIEQSKKIKENDISSICSFVIQYLKYLFEKCSEENELIRQIFVGLFLMTNQKDLFHFYFIQMIFKSLLPILFEYSQRNITQYGNLVYILMGKMSEVLINSYPLNDLENQLIKEVETPLFVGGSHSDQYDKSEDYQLLLSICENDDQTREFLHKVRMSLRVNEQILPKSIEEHVNSCCPPLFAVSIKYHRRINLLRHDLTFPLNHKIHPQLISLYKSSNSFIQNLFITRKGLDEDLNQLNEMIKSKCLFLLQTIDENQSIELIKEDQMKDKIRLQRQFSHWTKARCVIRLLRNLFKACLRFKRLIQHKNHQANSQDILNQSIQHFLIQNIQINQIQDFIQRQFQRANLRLFIYQFIQKILQDKSTDYWIYFFNQIKSFDFYILENISMIDGKLKQQIRHSFYSIIQIILNKFQSEEIIQVVFHLLNQLNTIEDIQFIFNYQILKKLLDLLKNPLDNYSLKFQLISFNWFRLITLQIVQLNPKNNSLNKEKSFIFNHFILNQLRMIKSMQNDQNSSINSLENLSIGWFNHLINAKSPPSLNSMNEIELYLNQYLILILQSIKIDENIRLICSNPSLIEILLEIYSSSRSKTTILLLLNLLGELISSLTNYSEEKWKNLIEKLLNDLLLSIGSSFRSDHSLLNQLIDTYRLIISRKSPYQIISIELIFKYFNQMNFNDEMNGSLAILQGFIQPISLSSVVHVKENRFGLIIDDLDETSKYLIEYFDNCEQERIDIQQLEIVNRISSIDFLSLPNGNEIIQRIFEKLFHLVQIDENGDRNLQIKRRSIQSLFYLLNNPKLIEIFLEKPYLSHIAQLTISPIDQLQLLTRQNLEKCYLKEKIKPSEKISNNHLIEYFSTSGWKSFGTKNEIEMLSDGRIGDNHLSIIPYPKGNSKENLIEECGIKHRFKGKIVPTSENIDARFPSFILENIRVYRGNWYYCIRLCSAGLVQIGWGTDGFSPGGAKGIGDDIYSWSFDGSRDRLFHSREFSTPFPSIRWKKNDVCGCGIEINDQSIQIKYWLNGKYLGTAFSHQENISSTSTKCNFLPNGSTTSFFPGISLQSYCDPPLICEWIFSPLDMNQCPLPHGFKPLLLPKLIHIENTIVPYPFNAYLVGIAQRHFVYTDRLIYPKKFLRDFVHQSHLDIQFNFDEDYLKLTKESSGFPLIIEENLSSFTISFQFQLEITESNDIQLLTINHSPIQFSLDHLDQKQTIVLLISFEQQQIHLFTPHKHQTSSIPSSISNNEKLHVDLLPNVDGKMKNVAVWKYSLSEEEIRRLFVNGLNYISKDFEELKEHEEQMNTFTFDEDRFSNGLILPFDQHFKEDLLEKKKEQFDLEESKYFQSSQIHFYGNKTYLVFNKTKQIWFEYSIILDLFIPDHSPLNQQITLLSINSKNHFIIDEQNHLSLLDNDEKHLSQTPIPLNQYFRLFLLFKHKSVQIYVNESLQIEIKVHDDRYAAKTNRLDLFKEMDLIKNRMNEETLRIKCQSITYLSQSIDFNHLDQSLKTANSSLKTLVYPSLILIGNSLRGIGYKESWIKSVIEEYHLRNIEEMNSILRKEKGRFIQMDLNQQNENYSQIFSRLNLPIDQFHSQTNFHEQLNNWKSFPSIETHSIELNDDENWFDKIIKYFNLNMNLTEWLEDKSEYQYRNEDNIPNTSSQPRRVFNLFDDDDDDDDENPSSNPFEILMNFFGKDSDENSFTPLNQSSTFNYQLIYLNSSEKDSSNEQLKEISNKYSLNEYENALIRIYARSIFENLFLIWTNYSKNSFPLEKFNDYQFLILFFRKMNEHLIAMNSSNINSIYFLIKSILHSQFQQKIFNENSFFHFLQKEIFIQLIQFIVDSNQLNNDSSNLKFVFEILKIYLELLNDKQLNLSIEDLYPEMLIKLLFNLFFLLKKHQSKIFILQLFSQLIQINENFMLPSDIQRIFVKLLQQLSKNKHLQIALMDLICVILIKKNQEKVVIQQNDLTKNVRNLLNIVQILNRVNDRTIVRLFLDEIEQISNDELKLNEDLLEKSFQYFDDQLDRQLGEFIDENLASEQSFNEFIENLSEKIESKSFQSLTNIPIELIQTRILFYFQLNQLLVQILPLIDFNLPLGQSYLTDQIRKAKFSLLYQIKFQLLNLSLEKTSLPNQNPTVRVSFNILKSTENQQSIFQQAFKQLYSIASVHFRRKLRQLWQSTVQISPYQLFQYLHLLSISNEFIEVYLVHAHMSEISRSFIFSSTTLTALKRQFDFNTNVIKSDGAAKKSGTAEFQHIVEQSAVLITITEKFSRIKKCINHFSESKTHRILLNRITTLLRSGLYDSP